MSCLYCDEDGRLVDIDRLTAATLGWRRHEVLNTLLVDYVHPDSMVDFERSWPELVATPGATREIDLRLRRNDGSWAAVSLTDTNRLADDDFRSVQSVVTFAEPDAKAAAEARTERSEDEASTVDGEAVAATGAGGDGGDSDSAYGDDSGDASETAAATTLVPPPLVPAPLPEPIDIDSSYVAKPRVGRRERLVLAAIVGIGFLLRIWDLGSLPISLHGDEATSGLEGVRILDEGWIGVYTPSALGQPTAPFYATALSIAVFGQNVFAVRVVSAIVGALTIYATFRVAAPRLGVRIALLAAGVLAVLNWHLLYSRLAFGVTWWPLVTLLAIGAIDRALRRDADGRLAGIGGVRSSWAFAGFLTAIGVYIYNAHWSVAAALTGAVALLTLFGPSVDGITGRLGRLGTFIGSAVITLVPMLSYIAGGNGYGNHFSLFSIRSGPDWMEASLVGKAGLFLSKYLTSWNRILFQPRPDLADGSGILRPVPLLFALAFLVGVGVLVARHRNALTALIVVLCLALPVGPAMTVDGTIRRDMAMAPLLAIVIAIALSFLWERLPFGGEGRGSWMLRTAVVVGLVVLIGGWSTRGYFDTFRDDPQQQWTFSGELAGPIEIMNTYGDNAEVNMYSRRHSLNYETIRFLAPGMVGRDRLAPFVDIETNEPHPDAIGPQLFVLIGPDTAIIAALNERYPNGELVADSVSGGTAYKALLVDSPNG